MSQKIDFSYDIVRHSSSDDSYGHLSLPNDVRKKSNFSTASKITLFSYWWDFSDFSRNEKKFFQLIYALVPVAGGWSVWSPWSSCDRPCGGGGLKYRSRRCDNPLPEFNGAFCEGQQVDNKPCGQQQQCTSKSRIFFLEKIWEQQNNENESVTDCTL